MNKFKLLLVLILFFSCSDNDEEISGNKGLYYQTILFDGLSRSYILYIPSSYDESENSPIVFNLHGGSGTAEEQMNYVSDMRNISDNENFILVYPQAHTDSNGIPIWNLGGVNSKATDVDDVGFISHLINKIAEFYSVDRERAYVAGFSNGGYLSFELACKLSSEVAAFASVAGHMFIDTYDNCSPTHPTPFLSINGTEDNYDGIAGYYLPIENSNSYWVEYNKTDIIPEVIYLEDQNTSDGSTVEYYSWKNGTNGVEIDHYKVIGGDHSWPSLNANSEKGKSNGDIDSDKIIWEFFSRFDINGLR